MVMTMAQAVASQGVSFGGFDLTSLLVLLGLVTAGAVVWNWKKGKFSNTELSKVFTNQYLQLASIATLALLFYIMSVAPAYNFITQFFSIATVLYLGGVIGVLFTDAAQFIFGMKPSK